MLKLPEIRILIDFEQKALQAIVLYIVILNWIFLIADFTVFSWIWIFNKVLVNSKETDYQCSRRFVSFQYVTCINLESLYILGLSCKQIVTACKIRLSRLGLTTETLTNKPAVGRTVRFNINPNLRVIPFDPGSPPKLSIEL